MLSCLSRLCHFSECQNHGIPSFFRTHCARTIAKRRLPASLIARYLLAELGAKSNWQVLELKIGFNHPDRACEVQRYSSFDFYRVVVLHPSHRGSPNVRQVVTTTEHRILWLP